MSKLHFFYVGNFRQVRSTEEYVAKALEQLGYVVHRYQENLYDPTTLLQELRLTQTQYPTSAVVFFFSKCEIQGLPFRETKSNPAPLIRLLAQVRLVPKVLVGCWLFDLVRFEFSPARHKWAVEVSKYCDLFLTTDSGNDDDHALSTHRTLRQGYPGPLGPERIERAKQRDGWVSQVAHVGEVYGLRRPWLRELRRAFGDRLKHFTSVFEDDLFDLCRSATLIVGPSYPYCPGYWSNRLYVVTGYGGCFACPEVEGMRDEGWVSGIHYVELPRQTDDAIELLRAMLHPGNAEFLRRVAMSGRALCQEHHTYYQRVTKLVELVREKL